MSFPSLLFFLRGPRLATVFCIFVAKSFDMEKIIGLSLFAKVFYSEVTYSLLRFLYLHPVLLTDRRMDGMFLIES